MELRYTSTNNTAVGSFTLAVDRRFTKKGEERQADFIQCVAWDKTAEFISKWFSKGSAICVVGRIQTRNWEDGEGKKRYTTEVVVEECYFAGSKSESSKDNDKQDKQGNKPESSGAGEYESQYHSDDDSLPF